MKTIKYHVLVLTAENALIYVEYSKPVSHLEVYQEFYKDGVHVKDSFIQEGKSWNLAEILLKAINNWVIRHFEEDCDRNSVSISHYHHDNQYIIMELHGRTESGKPFKVRPSELISQKINFFSEFC